MLGVLDGLTDELTRFAIYENWKHRVGRQTDLRIKFSAPDLTVRQEGYFQVINLEGHEITIGSNATDEQIAAEIARIRNTMPTIAEQLRAARADIANARQGAVDAVAQTGEAVQVVKEQISKLQKEAADFRAEVAELTNGGPEL